MVPSLSTLLYDESCIVPSHVRVYMIAYHARKAKERAEEEGRRMASKPGLFTEWPWKRMGNFKYFLLAPWVGHSVYSFLTKGEGERDLSRLLILPVLLMRVVHSQLWISLARFQTARSKHQIVHKGLEFEQVDREMNWDDQIIFSGLVLYITTMCVPGASHLSWWDTKGVLITILVHMGPVEFLYYWLHRALHHHFLYARYHSHHHASIVTEPMSSVNHPFIEELFYFILFSLPFFTMAYTRTANMAAAIGYITYVDIMNYIGHCNFELVPRWLFETFPLLKYLMYTPSFHSLHHTQFRTNYSLFMPVYDYIYGTLDKSSDELYQNSLKGNEDIPQVVHLTHLTSLQSIYHLRIGFTSLASQPYAPRLYTWFMWPLSYGAMLLTWISGSAFVAERNRLKKLEMQTWAIPRYRFQYVLSREKQEINRLIEEAIIEADKKGVKVISLGLLNQREELNQSGELYLQKYPKLHIRIIDGSSLAAAIVLNSIPQGTEEVLLTGKLSKIACTLTVKLCQRGIKVWIQQREDFETLKLHISTNLSSHFTFAKHCNPQVWLVGDGLTDEEQRKAAKGTRFIPFSQFPQRKIRKDCIYHNTPAMVVPKTLENMHSCENWLPRRAMSAWRVAGIVHALEEWDTQECGGMVNDVEKVWSAALDHGFLHLPTLVML